MNDQQFEALLASISKVSESIDDLSERVAAVAAVIVKIGDPEGWSEALEMSDDDEDDDFEEYDE